MKRIALSGVVLSRGGLADTIKRQRAIMFKARRRAELEGDHNRDYYQGEADGIAHFLLTLRIDLEGARGIR